MKTLFLALILTFVFGTFAAAQTSVKIGVGKQKTATTDKLKIKFVTMVEDSRCPTDTNCIWAGNAKIKIKVTDFRGRTKFFDLNTGSQPQAATFAGYDIRLEDLTPAPASNIRINRNGYTATFKISRMTR